MGDRTRTKRIIVSFHINVDGSVLINILIIEFLEINDELLIVMDIRILPRDQEAVLQLIVIINL